MKEISQNSQGIDEVILENREGDQYTLKNNQHIFRVGYLPDLAVDLTHFHTVKKLILSGDLKQFATLSKRETELFLSQCNDHLKKNKEQKLVVFRQEQRELENIPAEWTSSMWIEVAKLQLRLSIELLEDSLELSNLTPSDIEFIGTKPRLTNPFTIRKISPHSFEWEENKNFRNRFLNPIIRFIELGIPFRQSLLFERGVEPESLLKEAGWIRSLSPSLFTNALLPSILTKKTDHKNFFHIKEVPLIEAILEYRQTLYSSILKEIQRLEEKNITKNPPQIIKPFVYPSEQETWLKEKINFYHPETLLEINSRSSILAKFASEIGIRCVSLQNEENICDRNYRESRRLSLHNLCLNTKVTSYIGTKFGMVLFNEEEFQSATLQSYSEKDLVVLIESITSCYLIMETHNWYSPSFIELERGYGFILYKKRNLPPNNVV